MIINQFREKNFEKDISPIRSFILFNNYEE